MARGCEWYHRHDARALWTFANHWVGATPETCLGVRLQILLGWSFLAFPNARGFPLNSGGLGAGGVFTDVFRRRPREGPMENGVGERSPGVSQKGDPVKVERVATTGKEGKGLEGGIRVRGFVLFFFAYVRMCLDVFIHDIDDWRPKDGIVEEFLQLPAGKKVQRWETIVGWVKNDPSWSINLFQFIIYIYILNWLYLFLNEPIFKISPSFWVLWFWLWLDCRHAKGTVHFKFNQWTSSR